MPEYKLRVSDELHQRVEGARCGVPRERWLRGVIEAALGEGLSVVDPVPVRPSPMQGEMSVPSSEKRSRRRRAKKPAPDAAAAEVLRDRVEAVAVERDRLLSRADAFRATNAKRGKS